VKVTVEEGLPTAQGIDRDVNWQDPRLDRVGELVEVEHSLVAAVGRHHHIDVQVSDDC
jgi:hypothetical protein